MRSRILWASVALLLVAVLYVCLWQAPTRQAAPVQVAASRPRTSRTVTGGRLPEEAVAAPAQKPLKVAEKVVAKIEAGGEIVAFDAWSQSYLKAEPAERAKLVAEGVELARARRPVFKQLIKDDPKAALANAVPMVVRQKLPTEVLAQLEKRVNQTGALWVKMGTPMPGEELPTKPLMYREAEFDGGKFYSAYVYGQRAKVQSVSGASLNGVAVDGDFAVNEAPSRTLEAGEIPPADKPAVAVCPVSGLQTAADNLAPGEPLPETTPAVETATQIVYFCDGAHVMSYNQTLLLGEGTTGGAFGFTGLLPATPTPALGTVKVLAIPMTYADQNAIPATEATLYSTLRDVSEFYSKASYGRLTLIGTVCPAVKLPHNEAWYVNRDTSNGGDISGTSLEHLHARDEARKLGFDTNEFDSLVVRHNGGPGSYGGLATVPGNTVWVRTDGAGTWAHEIGHSFSLLHANFWDTAGTSSIGNGANAEYGDTYDIMGSASFPQGHYNAQGKNQIKWLTSEYLQPVSSSGLYRIYAFDQGLLDPSRRYAMTIVKDAQRTYWGEVRTQFDSSNPWSKSGMVLGWRFPNGGASNIHLIDTTNGSPFAKDDAPISIGNTFSDTESGIHMTTVAANDSPRYVDVQVNFGDFPTNQRPTMTLASSADVVPLNATVTFTATASDPDGDTLAYAWQHFGNTSTRIVSPNAAVITRQFTAAGSYVVTCTVSDMKGGTVTRNKLITVGSSSTFTISGRVTQLGAGLQDVVVTANGSNGVVTDADGYFVVPNLTANTYTLTPLLYGYSFTELFNNSVTVGPNFSGANFDADGQPAVTLTTPLPTANELAPVTAGSFRLTRTGDTSQPLVVNVNSALGSATKTTDYTFTPDYVTGSLGFSTFTIPANSATLDVVVTPVVDALAEGPESVILQLGPGIGYVVEVPSAATVIIADDDTTLPKVSLSATVPNTTENSGTPMVLTAARTGTPTGPLTVYYAVSGTATSGVDFTPLTGSVIIPDGAASATVNISPINDALAETVETVVATLTADATYLVDPNASSATATIYDDDTQTVSVAATDATATEIDLTQPGAKADTGTFVVTRSGDTSAALTVYYAFAGVYNSGVMALHGVDFEAMPGSVVIPAGQTQASITIVPRFDGIGEGPELVVLYLGGSSSNYVLGGSGTATVTILDNPSDLPSVDVANISSATEGGSSGIFRITVRGGTGTGTLAVGYSFTGTASAGDFSISGTGNTLTGTSITLNNGAIVTKDVLVTAVDDAVQEDVESLTLTLGSSAAYQAYAQSAQATLWLKDNDYTNTVTVDTQVGVNGANSVAEGNVLTPVKFYIARTGSTASALTVNYTLGGTATNGADYDGGITIATPTSGVATVLRDVWGADTSNIWAVGDSGVILKWNGTAWAAQTSGTTANLLRVWGTDASNVWAVGSGGTIRFWNGSTWSAQTSGTTNILRSVHGSSTTNVWAAGDAGTVLKWNGSSWVAQTFGLTNPVNAVWVVDASNVWAAGSGGLIRYWNGTVWATQTTNTSNAFNGLWGTSTSSLWAAGAGGTLMKWNGSAWTAQVSTTTTNTTITAISGTDSSNLCASLGLNQALITSVGGAQWTPILLPGTATYNGIWRAPTGQTWAVGTAGTIVSWNWASGATLTGSVTIPAGSLGADVNLRVLDDTVYEGTEKIAFDFASGSYSRSPGTVMYLTDNDTPVATVGFQATGSAGSESTTSVSIPVTLSAAQSSPVTVEYAVSGTTSSSVTSLSTHALPFWVRIVKTGDAITHFESNDGLTWVQRGSTFTVSGLGSSSYLAGLVAASGSTTTATEVIDNFSVSGLSAGGSAGAETAANLGNASPSGTHTVTSGVYNFNTPGNGVASSSNADNFRYVYVPVSNSANCTITARMVSLSTTSGSARIGVMLRSSTVQGSVYAASLAGGSTSNIPFYTMNRLTLSANSNNPSSISTLIMPQCFRLTRAGNVFTSDFSKDGSTWTTQGSQTLVLGPSVLAGLAVSAATDGLIATGSFDNVTLNGVPATDLVGRTVGFVNEQGSESYSAGTWTLNGSGALIGNSSDEAHFAAKEITGDFTLVARVNTITNGASTAQAGLMARQTRDGYSRMMFTGCNKTGTGEYRYRAQGVTSAFGSGVDFLLTPGVLTFAPGDTVQNIVLNVVNDSVDEPNNVVTLQLSNASGADIPATAAYYGYTILDDDSPPASPFVGFASASSTVLESDGTVNLVVSLSTAPAGSVTVDYSATGGTGTGGGTDYTLAAGTLTFAAGETVKTIPLVIVDDSVVDPAETIVITLANPVGLQLGSITAETLTITDNDLPVVSITATDASASEAGDPGQFTLSRTGSTAGSLTVSLTLGGSATSGTDYTAIATTQTIPAGAASMTVNVAPLQDATNEGTETVILTVATGSSYTIGTPSTATVNLLDDDRCTVSLVANDASASETPGNPGQFTFTRTAPTTGSLTVGFTIAGTATNGTDYTTVSSSVTFSAGQATRTVDILPVDDSVTEGDEQVTFSLNTGSYDIDAQSFGSVTITDNDSPPTLFIDSPGSQGLLIASGNGVIVSATITDDGAPAPVTQAWSQISGPGVATIESPTAATTAVTFSAPGTYIIRITATDTQFTVSDQVAVVVGSALVAADWITHDLGPSSARRGQGISYSGQYTVTGTGAGYATSSDQAHVMMRQISGDGSIVARLTSLSSATALSGVSIRDSMLRSGTRAVLGLVPGSTLQFRTRTTANTTDTLAASVAAPALPLWLKLDRNSTTGGITASYSPDSNGSPGSWVQLGATTTITMDAAAQYGLTTTSNSTASSATGLFDHVSLTPAQTGPALLSEEAVTNPAAAGSADLTSGTYTIVGSTTGYYYGWQYYGDMVMTTRLATFSSGAGSASGGVRVAESMENGAYLHLGRLPTSAFNGYYWTSLAGGSGGGVPSGINAGDWIRIVRKGNSITGFRAPNSGGNPGTWVQIGQPQTIIMTTPVWVGFYVNNSTGVGLNTCTFTNLTIAPLNSAPVVGFATMATWPLNPVAIHGTVTDDNYPTPVTLSNQWSKISGPGAVTFGSATTPDTTATLAKAGSYVLRLTADDTAAQSFKDLSFTGYTKAYEVWQAQNWTATGGFTDPNATDAQDPDFDGQANLLEYAFGTGPLTAATSPLVFDTATVSTDKFLRINVPKNAAATDVTFTVEATSDLHNPASWSSAGLVTEQDTSTRLIVRDSQPMSSGGPRFMRVKVVRN